MEKVIPELVVEEKGYKGVAYARATAIIAEAVKELRMETNLQLQMMKEEIELLRQENALLRRKLGL